MFSCQHTARTASRLSFNAYLGHIASGGAAASEAVGAEFLSVVRRCFFSLAAFIAFKCLRCLLVFGIVALLISLLIAFVRDNLTKKKGREARDH